MTAPVALIDANVWYSVPLRDLLMQLATSQLFRPRWTTLIDDEWTRNLLANRPDITGRQIEFTKLMMRRAVPDGLVDRYESIIDRLVLPDADDRHVLAAAITSNAEVIVTFNRRDFPAESLRPYDIEAQHPDDFIAALIELAPETVLAAAYACRARLMHPALSAETYTAVLERQALNATATFLRKNIGSI